MPEQLAALPPTADTPPPGATTASGRRFGPSTSFRDYSFESMVARTRPGAAQLSARPAPEPPSASAAQEPAEPVGGIEEFLFGADGFQFEDLIDIVNPLQHIPLLSILYREWTGDQIAAAPRVLGGALFGGYIGAAASVVDAVIEAETGDDIGQHALAFLFGDEDGAPAGGAADTAIAEAAPSPLPAGAVQVAGRPWLDGSLAKGDVLAALVTHASPAAGALADEKLPPGAVAVSGRPWLGDGPQGKEQTLAAFSRNGMPAGHALIANLPANGLPPGAVNVVGRPWLTGVGAQAPAPVAATHRPAPTGPGLFRAGERPVTPVVPALAGAPLEAARPPIAVVPAVVAVGSIPVLLAEDANRSAAESTPDRAGFSRRMMDGLAKYGTLMRERNGAEAGIDIRR